MPTMGVPTAAAMWAGPVSPETKSAAPRASATRSAMDVRGDSTAVQPDEATTARASDSSPGPQSTTDVTPGTECRAEATRPSRDGGHRLVGHAAPGFNTA